MGVELVESILLSPARRAAQNLFLRFVRAPRAVVPKQSQRSRANGRDAAHTGGERDRYTRARCNSLGSSKASRQTTTGKRKSRWLPQRHASARSRICPSAMTSNENQISGGGWERTLLDSQLSSLCPQLFCTAASQPARESLRSSLHRMVRLLEVCM